MTDVLSNAKSSNMRRVRLKPNLSNKPSFSKHCLHSSSINNAILPPPPPPPPPLCYSSAVIASSFQKKSNMTKSSTVVKRVLKPSLRKLEAPLCTDSTTVAATTTTNSNKSVRFNVPLAQVMHFYTPPPSLDECDEEEEEEEEKLEDTFLDLVLPNKGLQGERNPFDSVQQQPTANRLLLLNWPSSLHQARRFISQMVSLENIVWNNAFKVVQGSVLVHNIAYEKKVTVRCSFDCWKSWADIEAYYKEAAFNKGLLALPDAKSGNNNAFDRFTFEIDTNAQHASNQFNIAIRYQTLGQEFWDNNNGNNFTVIQSMIPSRSLQTLKK